MKIFGASTLECLYKRAIDLISALSLFGGQKNKLKSFNLLLQFRRQPLNKVAKSVGTTMHVLLYASVRCVCARMWWSIQRAAVASIDTMSHEHK